MASTLQPGAGNSSTASKQQLSVWGLPQPILESFHKKGLKQLYPWQAAALDCAAAGNNLVYCAPTSGGKSLVADVLMLSRLHTTQQALLAKAGSHRGHKPQQPPVTRALIVLPYLSIVSEKSQHLSKLLEPVKWRVMGYKGDDADGQPLSHPAERISICSIEKANGAINKLIQEQRLHELVSVTIDEAHMLADTNRGAALEMLLSKLIASRNKSSIQIVAMSATMSGLDSLSSWLDAHLFLTNFRPVPLTEHAVFQGTVYAKTILPQLQSADASAEVDSIMEEQRTLDGAGNDDKQSLLALVSEVVAESHSVLVFCAGRKASQNCAELLRRELHTRVGPPSASAAAARADLIEKLRIDLSGSTDPAFEKLLAAGVAYHHAGLTSQERAVVEQGFSSGALLVLTATSTLAAGVNLPARRVILRSLWQGVGDVSRAQYLQMVGRAGRAGHSAIGEAFLMGRGAAHTHTGEWPKVCKLLAAPLPVLQSQLVQQPVSAHPKPPRGHAPTQTTQADSQQQQNQQQQQQQQQHNGPSQPAGHTQQQQQHGTLPPPGHPQQQQQQQQHGSLQPPAHPQSNGGNTLAGSVASGGVTCGSASEQITAMSGGCGGGLAAASGPPCAESQAGSSGAGSGRPTQQQQQQQQGAREVNAAVQPHLQHLLLDVFATGLATTGQSVQLLLQSTLAFLHVPWEMLAAAAHSALAALRARKLITLVADSLDKPTHWKLTPLGRAVVASALDPGTGLKLYSRLDSMRSCTVLGTNVHLLYVLQTSAPLAIFDWSIWLKFMRELTPAQRRVAEVEGIDMEYIHRRVAGRPGNAISDEQHGRFAAAVLLDRVVTDVNSMRALEQAWGKAEGLTKQGITRGMFQKWQGELSKTAAMAALLANEAEWWHLETLLSPLAAQVAAGVRPELLPLMKVPDMQPSHAAALHAAGFGHPDLLLCASESEIAAALAAGLPANMRKRKNMDKKGPNVGLTGNAGTNAMVSRAARSVLTAARQYAVLSAAEAAASVLAGEAEDEPGSLASQLPAIRAKALMGQATVHQAWPRKGDPLLSKLLDAWQLQSTFALALVMKDQMCSAAAGAAAASSNGGSSGWLTCSGLTPGQQEQQGGGASRGGAGGGTGACAALHGPLPAALLLCWSDKEAVVLHLPPIATLTSSSGSSGGSRRRRRSSRAAGGAPAAAGGAAAPGDETAQRVWSVIGGVLGDANRTVICAGAVQVLAALSSAGVAVKAAVDDPCAAFLLWQPRGLDNAASAAAAAGVGGAPGGAGGEQQDQGSVAAAEEASKAAAAVVLGGAFKLQVPLLPGSTGAAATSAAKAVLLGRALMPPLRAMLAKQQLTAAYEDVERPLLQAFAEVRAGGVRISTDSILQQVLLCDWQKQMLQQQVMTSLGQQQQQTQQDTQCADMRDSDIRLLLHQQRLVTVSNERLQQQPLLQLVQAAVRTAIKRQHAAALQLLRPLLTYCQVQQYQQQLQLLLQQYSVQPAAGDATSAPISNSNSWPAATAAAVASGCVVLQPHPAVEPVIGQLTSGLPVGFKGLLGYTPVPNLPVLMSSTSLAQQGFRDLVNPVTVAAAVHMVPVLQQQQQQRTMYVVGKLCSINPLPAAAEQVQSNSQLLPWQVSDESVTSAGAAAGSNWQLQQQHTASSTAAAAVGGGARMGSVRVWCGATDSIREMQIPTAALFSILKSPKQQQWQQQWQHCSSNGSSSSGCLTYPPGYCSLSHLVTPNSSRSTFIGVQFQHLPLLALAGLSQDNNLILACTQNTDPLAAAAAAWLPSSGLPQQLQGSLLRTIQWGVLDGVPVPAAAAPGVLFAVAVQALVLGLKPSAQREQLGAGEWPKGTNLADSLLKAFPQLQAWREKLLEDVKHSRFLTTPLGRKIPFRLPSAGPNQPKAAAKQLKEAQRSAVSLLQLASIGDVQRLLVVSIHRACSAWQASNHSSSAGGGVRGSGSGSIDRSGAGDSGQLQRASTGPSVAGAGPSAAAAAAAGSGTQAPGRLLPGCQNGAPSGFAVGAASEGQDGSKGVRFVAVSASRVVLEVPSAWALPLLQCCAQQVGQEVGRLLGLEREGLQGGGVKLPFRWWWGGSLDELQGNAFTV